MSKGGMPRPSVVAIGKFEGVHLGHQTIIGRLIAEAETRGERSFAFTFMNNPLSVLAPERCPKPLMSPEQRAETLLGMGVDEVVMVDFDERFAAQTPEEFVRDELALRTQATHVIVGDDFRFGAKAEGTPEILTELGETYGFTVEIIDEIADAELGRISSSRIREALSEGDVERAAQLLGAPHWVRGRVVHGDARGRELGFPTANLGPREGETRVEGFVPQDGVYAGFAHVAGSSYTAAISVGNNPTFTPDADSRVEAFLLDMQADLYGQDMVIEFTHRLRPMLKFDGIDKLLEAMHADVHEVRKLLP